MPKPSPSAYTVTVTGVRDYDPPGPPKKNQLWDFTQMVWSDGGHEGALSAMLDKFFKFYPQASVLLPVGEKGGKFITKGDKDTVTNFLSGKGATKRGDFELESDDAVLKIVKMRALSGDTPHSLTPHSESDYLDRLQQNTESYKWWMDGIVQMPSPLYVNQKAGAAAHKSVRYRGKVYVHVAEASPDTPFEELKALFGAQMESVVDKLMEISAALMESGDMLDGGKSGFVDKIRDSARSTYHELLPGILGVYDTAKVLQDKLK